MDTTEVKEEKQVKGKRVRRCYPRTEIYHRFIHDSTYIYNRANPIFAVGNILVVGKSYYDKNPKTEDVIKYHSHSVIAIINRDKKRILINLDFSYHTWDLYRAVPDDFEIFYTNQLITSLDVIDDYDQLYRRHTYYLINTFIKDRLYLHYAYLNGCRRHIYMNVNSVFKYDNTSSLYRHYGNITYSRIYDFAKRYKLKNYDWYNKPLASKDDITIYSKRNVKTISINFPSLKQVIENKLFSEKEIYDLTKWCFYCSNCYGYSIKLAWVEENYGKTFTVDEFYNWAGSKNLVVDKSWFKVEKDTWENFIIKTREVYDNIQRKYIERQLAKSKQNYKDAVNKAKELVNSNCTINDWRENKGNLNNIPRFIPYEQFYVDRGKNYPGTWRTNNYYFRYENNFTNIQLKLKDDKTILTSRGVTVPLSEGIKVFKLFTKWLYSNPKETQIIFDNQPRVGIYNLRFIRYKEKVTDIVNNPLGFKDWVIQIGCHSLWLTDVKDFIKYYKLEKEFGLIDNK